MSDNPHDIQLERQIGEVEKEALMMWVSKQKKLMDRIDEGVKYFESKYGLSPNVCIVNPDDAQIGIGETLESSGDLFIATAKWCLKGHCLIGIITSKDSVWGVGF